MKCLSCGSSAEKNNDNACSYCGSVIRVDTFKSLLSIVREVKDSFKFSTSEQTIGKLPHKEQNDAYHTHILILIDRKLWTDVEKISTKARNIFPTDSMFDIYKLIALICKGRLINKSANEIKEITDSIVEDKNRVPPNIKGFFIDAINVLWCNRKKINQFKKVKWKPDNELKSLIKILGEDIVDEIDEESKLKDTKSGKTKEIHKLIDDIVYKTNRTLEKNFYSKYDNGIDTIIKFANKEIANKNYKKNVVDMMDFYKKRAEKYKDIFKKANNDFSKSNLEKNFRKIEEINETWSSEIPLSLFDISNRKEKKKMAFCEPFLKIVPKKIQSEIDEMISSMRFV
tara:strand:+ start:3796 stop:4821 length:1026 start_codon:yes stop_codon:yes gene_type:complete